MVATVAGDAEGLAARAALAAAAREVSPEFAGAVPLAAAILSSGSGKGARSGSELSGTYPSAPLALRTFT